MAASSSTSSVLPPPSSPRRIRVLVAGPPRSGKSCTIRRLVEGKFLPKYNPTVGVDFGVHAVDNVEGPTPRVRVQFFDLAGGPEFAPVRDEFYSRGGDGGGGAVAAGGAAGGIPTSLLLVFDLTDRASFEALPAYLEEAAAAAGASGGSGAAASSAGSTGGPSTSILLSSHLRLFVCGNKCEEAEKREVQAEEAKKWAADIGADG
jgi:DnaJ family protein C protein 27